MTNQKENIENHNNRRYGFNAHLTREFPSQIVVDVTENCNLACIHCPHESLKKSGRLSGGFLEPALNQKLVQEIAAVGKGRCGYIRYTAQGEPLLHPDISAMLEYAVKFSGVSVNLTTNGMLLLPDAAQKLLEGGIDVVDISIDAFFPKTYQAIRRKGSLEITCSNVLDLIKLRNAGGFGTKIVVSFVDQELNQGESDRFKAFWEEKGADRVVIRRLHSASGAVKTKTSELAEEERYPCIYPWERLSLGADGFIHFCPQDWVHGSIIADFRETEIATVWQGEQMSEVREAHLKRDFSGLAFCGTCHDWRHTRWPEMGRSYSDMMSEFGKEMK